MGTVIQFLFIYEYAIFETKYFLKMRKDNATMLKIK